MKRNFLLVVGMSICILQNCVSAFSGFPTAPQNHSECEEAYSKRMRETNQWYLYRRNLILEMHDSDMYACQQIYHTNAQKADQIKDYALTALGIEITAEELALGLKEAECLAACAAGAFAGGAGLATAICVTRCVAIWGAPIIANLYRLNTEVESIIAQYLDDMSTYKGQLEDCERLAINIRDRRLNATDDLKAKYDLDSLRKARRCHDKVPEGALY